MVLLFAPFVVSSVFLPMGRDSPKPTATSECLKLTRQRVRRNTPIQLDGVAHSNICVYEPILWATPGTEPGPPDNLRKTRSDPISCLF